MSLRPNDPQVALTSVKQCIYCGAREFSPGSGTLLSDEHIIAEGLGARFVLPEASCSACADKTKAIETDVLRGVLWTPRRQLNIRGKKRKRDESYGYPIIARIGGADVEFRLPIEDHPTLFLAIVLNPPGIVVDRPDSVSGIQSVMAIELNDINKAQEHGATAVMTPIMDTLRFSQMLAKIAHGFAVSQFSLRGFHPVLPDFILHPFGKDDMGKLLQIYRR
jgi:hypothetical protein